MSRLYCWVRSDTGETAVTKTGNKHMTIEVNYGSKDHSKRFVTIDVDYWIGMDRPIVKVTTS